MNTHNIESNQLNETIDAERFPNLAVLTAPIQQTVMFEQMNHGTRDKPSDLVKAVDIDLSIGSRMCVVAGVLQTILGGNQQITVIGSDDNNFMEAFNMHFYLTQLIHRLDIESPAIKTTSDLNYLNELGTGEYKQVVLSPTCTLSTVNAEFVVNEAAAILGNLPGLPLSQRLTPLRDEIIWIYGANLKNNLQKRRGIWRIRKSEQ